MDPIGERAPNGNRRGAIHPVRLPQLIRATEAYAQQHGSPAGTVHATIVRQQKPPGLAVTPGDLLAALRAEFERAKDALDAMTDQRDGLKGQLDQIAALATGG